MVLSQWHRKLRSSTTALAHTDSHSLQCAVKCLAA
jgi:hypothetical protein